MHRGRSGVLGEGGGDLFKVVAEYVGGRPREQRDAAQHEQKDDAGDGVRYG